MSIISIIQSSTRMRSGNCACNYIRTVMSGNRKESNISRNYYRILLRDKVLKKNTQYMHIYTFTQLSKQELLCKRR